MVREVAPGTATHSHQRLAPPGTRAIYTTLTIPAGTGEGAAVGEAAAGYGDAMSDPRLELALAIDATVRRVRPDGWRDVQSREQVIKAGLYDLLRDVDEVERLFLIIKAQPEY
jgi:type I restriction enzyme R subunit